MIFTIGKVKSCPLHYNLLVYWLLSIIRLSPSQLLPPNYNFYKQNSNNKSRLRWKMLTSAAATIASFKPTATISASEKARMAKDVLNRKFLLLILLCWHFCCWHNYNYFSCVMNKKAKSYQPSHHNLLVYLLLSIIRQTLSQLLQKSQIG